MSWQAQQQPVASREWLLQHACRHTREKERFFARRFVAVAWVPHSIKVHHTVLFCLKWALEGMLLATSEAQRSEAA